MVSSSGENYKYFSEYKDDFKIKPLYVVLSKLKGCTKKFGGDIIVLEKNLIVDLWKVNQRKN